MEKQQKAVSRIALLREQKGLTQLELGQLLGVTENTVANWEKGRSSLEWIDRVINMCKLFKCTPDQLVEYVPDTEPMEVKSKIRRNKLEEFRKLINTHEPVPGNQGDSSDTEVVETSSNTKPSSLEDSLKSANAQETTSIGQSQTSKSQDSEA